MLHANSHLTVSNSRSRGGTDLEPQNATVKRFRALARSRHAGATTTCCSKVSTSSTKRSPPDYRIDTVAFSETAAAGTLNDLLRRVEASGGRATIVSDAVFDAVTPVQHSAGVVAIARLAASAWPRYSRIRRN